MKTVLIKKIGSALFLSLCLTGIAFAQSSTSGSGTGSNPPPASPGGPVTLSSLPPLTQSWPYKVPLKDANATASVEMNSAYYLPWIGGNLQLLVQYALLAYQQQVNSATSPGDSAFNTAGTLAANNQLSAQTDTNTQAASATTASEYQAQLTFFPNTGNLTTYAQSPGTDVCSTVDPPTACQNPTNAQFNADMLLSSTGYPASNRPNIDALITFLGNLTQPLPDPGFTAKDTTAARSALLQRGDVQAYILAIRTVGALQSMALSNFNMLAQEREIIKDLGTQAGMTTFPPAGSSTAPAAIADASQLQVDKFLVDRRVNNSAWYAAMNNASSIALQRESLFMMAEEERQLYELRMLNERMLATLSTMQMAMLALSNSQLNVQAQNIAQATTQAASSSSSSSSTSSSTPSGSSQTYTPPGGSGSQTYTPPTSP